MTLREFCRTHELDPGNISKLERGRLQAPQREERLLEYASYLRLNSQEWEVFRDLAAISAGKIPKDLTDKEVAKLLPVLFRVARGKEITEEGLRRLAGMIKKSW